MLAQFKLMILSLFMSANISGTNPNINMDVIDNLNEVVCISQAVQGEAGNQPFNGKVAVAHVILNRVRDDHFPNTACGVVKQPGQFDFKPKRLNVNDEAQKAQMMESIRAAVDAVTGKTPDPTRGALYYANLKSATDTDWLKKLRKVVKIRDHWFYARRIEPASTKTMKQDPAPILTIAEKSQAYLYAGQ